MYTRGDFGVGVSTGGTPLQVHPPAGAITPRMATHRSHAQSLLRVIQCSCKVLLAPLRRAGQPCAPTMSGCSESNTMRVCSVPLPLQEG